MRHSTSTLLLPGLLLVLLGACASTRITERWHDMKFDFRSLHTYTLELPEPTQEITAPRLQDITDALNQVLQRKGYAPVDPAAEPAARPDFTVVVGVDFRIVVLERPIERVGAGELRLQMRAVELDGIVWRSTGVVEKGKSKNVREQVFDLVEVLLVHFPPDPHDDMHSRRIDSSE